MMEDLRNVDNGLRSTHLREFVFDQMQTQIDSVNKIFFIKGYIIYFENYGVRLGDGCYA